MMTDKKNLRRISIVVTAQTKGNLERLAAVSGYKELGRVVDKLTREKMISLRGKENDYELQERRCKMTGDQKKAYEWAKNQNYPSVAARYAKELAGLVDELQSAPCARQKQDNNAPLTLDELREMDGEPVWIVAYPDWGHWELSADADDYVEDRDADFYGMKHNDPAGRYGLHKLGWLAYRQKPEEVQK